MRKLLLCASALALLLTAQKASAQASWGLAAGATVPMGDLADGVGTGYHGTVLLGVRPAGFPVGLRFEGDYTAFSAKGGGSGKINIMSAVVNGIAESGAVMPTKPYLIAGLGLYNAKVTGFDGETNLGINVGGGLKFALSGLATFAEIRFVNVMSDPSNSYLPITFGITW